MAMKEEGENRDVQRYSPFAEYEFYKFQKDGQKQAAADVLFHYSNFAMVCIGKQVRPCDLRFHLMKEISGIPTSLKSESSQTVASPDAMGESSSSGTARLDKADSFQAL